MSSEQRQTSLASISDAAIASLVRAVPRLATDWASIAGTDAEELNRADEQALADLRMAGPARDDMLLAALARYGLEHLLAVLDVADSAEDRSEGTYELAEAAGREFGEEAGCLFMAALAAGNDPIATEVRDRFASLLESVLAASKAGQQPDQDATAEKEPTGPATPPTLADLAGYVEHTLALREQGDALAADLRAAADAVESGRLPAPRVAADLTAWSAEVGTHVTMMAAFVQADGLVTLGAGLEELASRERAVQQEREGMVEDAARAARALHDQGLDHLIPALLEGLGVELPDLWDRTIHGPEPSPPPELATESKAVILPEPPPEPAPGVDEPAAVPESEQVTSAAAVPEAVTSPESAADAESACDPVLELITRAVPEPAVESELAPQPEAVWESASWAETVPAVEVEPVPEAEVVLGAGLAESPAVPPGATAGEAGESGDGSSGEVSKELQSPWDFGLPSLVARLLGEDRTPLAACVAAAAAEAPVRQRLLRFFCAAFACSPAALERQISEFSPQGADVSEMTADECRVLLAAALRVGLALGYSPVGLPSLVERCELSQDALRPLIDATVDVVQRGYRGEMGAAVLRQADLAGNWAAFRGRALHLRETLEKRTISYARATHVLHWIVRSVQPVGRALTLIADTSTAGTDAATAQDREEDWKFLTQVAFDLYRQEGRARLIAEADRNVSTPATRRKEITASARDRLHSSLGEVADLLEEFILARTAIRQASEAESSEMADEMARALSRLAEAGPPNGPGTVGTTALWRLAAWLRDPAPMPGTAASVSEAIRVELEPLYEIPRDADGRPMRDPTLPEVGVLISGRDPVTTMRGYLRAGNLAAARRVIASIESADLASLDDEVRQGAHAARRQHARALDEVDRIAARLRAIHDDEAASFLVESMRPLRDAPADRLDLAIGPLRDLAELGQSQLAAFRRQLHRRAWECACGEEDRRRILDLINDEEDEILGVEFLTMAEEGQPLPRAVEEQGPDFEDFFPAMVEVALQAARDQRDPISAVREAVGTLAPDPEDRQLADGLRSWRVLKRDKRNTRTDTGRRKDEEFRFHVANVLRMVGLTPPNVNWLQELSRTQRSGYATFRVKATPTDRAYVPSLGSQAGGDYDLTLVWDAVPPVRLLDFIDERRRTLANVIVYFNTLTSEQRLQLRRLTSHEGGKGFSPVVIDDPVAAWLSTRDAASWKLTQLVTLPFTTLNPYTPFAGGEVPEEVFVGRERERQAIESPTGSMFVYGGRQLGKSALLRRVEKLYTFDPLAPGSRAGQHPAGRRVAVYIDLEAASIGKAQEPAALWRVLARRLMDAGVLRQTEHEPSPDTVVRQLSAWLAADEGNRLLLLLDEADNFLTVDSQGNPTTNAEFPMLQRLKGLMEDSGRRFKAVFAGLHQVQRFHDSSNTPVAHGGADILIGQLSSMDAYRLVVGPMSALGYEFASPEVVWRLLLLTNYQASLVQILCDALVTEVSRRPLEASGGRIRITADDVDAVYAKREVRKLIVERFRWTINLDPSYRVIALVVALRSIDSDPGEAFEPDDLREECELYWPAGFADSVLSDKEFGGYLEELAGLGVLHRRQDGKYGLRSPNIISLLGTRQSLSQELENAPRNLEVRYEYNPAMNRRILGSQPGLGARRSPLSDQDIARLLGRDGGIHSRVQIVTGSPALAIDWAARVIQDVAQEQQVTCSLVPVTEVDPAVSDLRGPAHLVVDLSRLPAVPTSLAALCERLVRRPMVTATVIVGPWGLPVPRDSVTAEGKAVEVTALRRWSIQGLRSWHDSPFMTPDLRQRLHRITSGWPLLVEETMRVIDQSRVSPDDALEHIIGLLAEPSFAAAHLDSCGVDASLAVRWASAQYVGPGEDGLDEAFPASLEEITEVLGADAGGVIERLAALDAVESSPDGWVLDRAVLAAALAVR